MPLREFFTLLGRHWLWALLLGVGMAWGLYSFERRIRADQHEQDMKMFRAWVAGHVDRVSEGKDVAPE